MLECGKVVDRGLKEVKSLFGAEESYGGTAPRFVCSTGGKGSKPRLWNIQSLSKSLGETAFLHQNYDSHV